MGYPFTAADVGDIPGKPPLTTEQKQAIADERNERAVPSAAKLIADTKAEARNRIVAVYPDWKQINMVARGVELQDIFRLNGQWSTEEQGEAALLSGAWLWVKTIRAASNEIEARISAMTALERYNFKVAEAEEWPD